MDSIKGVGFKKAVKLVQQFGSDVRTICKEVKQTILMGQPSFDSEVYIRDFERAHLTFKHQVVWDPSQERLTHLRPLDAPNHPTSSNLDFLGDIDREQS